MTAQAQPVAERPAWFLPGVRMAVLGIVVLLATQQVVNTGSRYQ